jgi:hypothetical protein
LRAGCVWYWRHLRFVLEALLLSSCENQCDKHIISSHQMMDMHWKWSNICKITPHSAAELYTKARCRTTNEGWYGTVEGVCEVILKFVCHRAWVVDLANIKGKHIFFTY